MAVPTRIALLRGVNVGGRTRMPMAELREVCAGLGWSDVRTYIQSGNVLFRAPGARAVLEEALEDAVRERFGIEVPVVVQTAEEWRAHPESNPFPEAGETDPNLVMLTLSKAPPAPGAVEALRERAADGERVERRGDVLWIHYAGGSGRSKLSPSVLDRLVGSPVTTRNLRTVRKIAELAGGP